MNQQIERETEILEAILFGILKHHGQTRKNITKSPYIIHPIGVQKYVLGAGITDIDIIRACVLHDTIEDTNTTEEEIRQKFGDKTANIVLEVTDNKSLLKNKRKELQISHSITMSDAAKCVKLADKLDNLVDLRINPVLGWSEEYIIGTVIWMKKIVSNMFISVTDESLLPGLLALRKQFEIEATTLLQQYNINYENIENEESLLDNYINVLCVA